MWYFENRYVSYRSYTHNLLQPDSTLPLYHTINAYQAAFYSHSPIMKQHVKKNKVILMKKYLNIRNRVIVVLLAVIFNSTGVFAADDIPVLSPSSTPVGTEPVRRKDSREESKSPDRVTGLSSIDLSPRVKGGGIEGGGIARRITFKDDASIYDASFNEITFPEAGAFAYGGADTLFMIAISTQLLWVHPEIRVSTNELLDSLIERSDLSEAVKQLASVMKDYSIGSDIPAWSDLCGKIPSLSRLDAAVTSENLCEIVQALIHFHAQLMSVAVVPEAPFSERWGVPFNLDLSVALNAITYRVAQFCQQRHSELLKKDEERNYAALWKSYAAGLSHTCVEVDEEDPMLCLHAEEGAESQASVSWTSSAFAAAVASHRGADWVPGGDWGLILLENLLLRCLLVAGRRILKVTQAGQLLMVVYKANAVWL